MFKKMIEKINYLALALFAALMAIPGVASATAPTLTVPTEVDMTNVYSVAGVLIGGLFLLWGLRKVMGFLGR